MAKSTKPKTKKPTNARLTRESSSEQKVEVYIDKAVKQMRDEIVPRIDILDMRDKEQYTAARKIIIDSNAIASERQSQVETTVKRVKDEIDEIFQERKIAFAEFKTSIHSLHDKIDKHIEDETKEFLSIKNTLEKNTEHTLAIQKTIDDVSANGNKGLNASFNDMYSKLTELEKVTQGARARAKFWTVAHDIIENTALLKPLRYKWGAVLYIIIILLVVNTLLHALGWQFDVVSIVKWVLTLGKNGG